MPSSGHHREQISFHNNSEIPQQYSLIILLEAFSCGTALFASNLVLNFGFLKRVSLPVQYGVLLQLDHIFHFCEN